MQSLKHKPKLTLDSMVTSCPCFLCTEKNPRCAESCPDLEKFLLEVLI